MSQSDDKQSKLTRKEVRDKLRCIVSIALGVRESDVQLHTSVQGGIDAVDIQARCADEFGFTTNLENEHSWTVRVQSTFEEILDSLCQEIGVEK